MASVEWVAGAPPLVVHALEDASAGSFGAGDLVKMNSTGKVMIATAGLIFGIAKANANGSANYVHEIELINADSIYSTRYNGNTAQAVVGDHLDFTFTTAANGGHVASIGNNDAYCVDLDSRDALGTANGRILIRFKSANSYGAGQF
jgi:hypothetical protein